MSLKDLKLKQLSASITEGKPIAIEDIGQRIQDIRTALGMTQKQLAKKAKMSQPLLSRIEKDSGSCSLKTLTRIVQALGCDFLGAIYSKTSLEQKIRTQAELRAIEVLKRTFSNMALEKQAPNKAAYEFQLKTLIKELENNPDSTLWEE